MMYRFYDTVRGYIVTAIVTMLAGTVVFSIISAVASNTHGSDRLIAITLASVMQAIAAMLLLAYFGSASNAFEHLYLFSPFFRLLSTTRSHRRSYSLDLFRSSAALNTSNVLAEGNANLHFQIHGNDNFYFCVAIKRDDLAKNRYIVRQERKIKSRQGLSRAITYNMSSVDYIVKAIRSHEIELRSQGIEHIHIGNLAPFDTEHMADLGVTDKFGRICFLVFECNAAFKTSWAGSSSDFGLAECKKLFGKIVGNSNGIRGIKLLPDPKPMLDRDDAIDVF